MTASATTKRKTGRPRVIPQGHDDAMVADYLAGASTTQAAARFGYSAAACRNALLRAGIKPKGRSESHRKYNFDTHFFRSIDTEAKAYWLGFVTADGCVTRNSLQVNLQVSDDGHLKKFLAAVGSSRPVYYRTSLSGWGKPHTSAGIALTSPDLCEALRQKGVCERKSLKEKPCPDVPLELVRHYWRGVVDGDGGVWKRHDGHWMLSLAGSAELLEAFRQFVCTIVATRTRVRRPAGVLVYHFCLGGNRVAPPVLATLYGGATVSLDRKKVLADQAIAEYAAKPVWMGSFVSPEGVAYPADGNLTQFAREHGLTLCGLSELRRGHIKWHRGWIYREGEVQQ